MELQEVLHRRKDNTLRRINALRASLASIIAENNDNDVEECVKSVVTREGSEYNYCHETNVNQSVGTMLSNNTDYQLQNKCDRNVNERLVEQQQHLIDAVNTANICSNNQDCKTNALQSALNETLERHDDWSHVIMHVIDELQAIKNANTTKENDRTGASSADRYREVSVLSCDDMIDAKVVKTKLMELLREVDSQYTNTQCTAENEVEDSTHILELCDKLQSVVHEHMSDKKEYLEQIALECQEQHEQTLCLVNEQLHDILNILRTCATYHNEENDNDEGEVMNNGNVAYRNSDDATNASNVHLNSLLAKIEHLSREVLLESQKKNEKLERECSVTCVALEKAKQTIRRMTSERAALKRKVEQVTRTQHELEYKLTESEREAEHYKEQMSYALAQRAATVAECREIKRQLEEERLARNVHEDALENTKDDVSKENIVNMNTNKVDKMALRRKLMEFALSNLSWLDVDNINDRNNNECQHTKEQSNSSGGQCSVMQSVYDDVQSENRLVYVIKRWLDCKSVDKIRTQTLLNYMNDSGVDLQSCIPRREQQSKEEYIIRCTMIALTHSLHLITTGNKYLWHKLAKCLAHITQAIFSNGETEKTANSWHEQKQSETFAVMFTNNIRTFLHHAYQLNIMSSKQHNNMENSQSNANYNHLLVLYFATVCFTICRALCEEELLLTCTWTPSPSASENEPLSAFCVTRETENNDAHKPHNKTFYADYNSDNNKTDNDNKTNMELMQEVLHVILTHLATKEQSSMSAMQLLAIDNDMDTSETNFMTEVKYILQTSCALTLFAHPQHFSVQQTLLMRTLALVWQDKNKVDLSNYVVSNCNKHSKATNKCSADNTINELHCIKIILMIALSEWSQLLLTSETKIEQCNNHVNTINAIIKHWENAQLALPSFLQINRNNSTNTQQNDELTNKLQFTEHTQCMLHYILSCINKSLLPLLINTAFAFTSHSDCVSQLIDVYEVLYTYYTHHCNISNNNNNKHVDKSNKEVNKEINDHHSKNINVNNAFTSAIADANNFMHPEQVRCTMERIRDMTTHIHDVHVPESVMLASQEEVLFLLKENCEYKKAIAKLLDTIEHNDVSKPLQFINYT